MIEMIQTAHLRPVVSSFIYMGPFWMKRPLEVLLMTKVSAHMTMHGLTIIPRTTKSVISTEYCCPHQSSSVSRQNTVMHQSQTNCFGWKGEKIASHILW